MNKYLDSGIFGIGIGWSQIFDSFHYLILVYRSNLVEVSHVGHPPLNRTAQILERTNSILFVQMVPGYIIYERE